MENMFVWLFIFAGAASALLAIFLVASERELKNKQLEIDRLTGKLGENPVELIPATLVREQAIDSTENSELRTINQELHKEVATLSAKLELGQQAIMELAQATQRARDSQAEHRQLCKANEVLISEVIDLKAQLQTSDRRAQAVMNQQADAVEEQLQRQSEMAQLRIQLEEHQQKLRALEGSRQNFANFESLAASHSTARQQLESKIAGLEQELDSARQAGLDANSLRATLTESERQRQALKAETCRYEAEIRRWQQRSAEGDENHRRLSALRAPFDALLIKHAELAAYQHKFQQELAEFDVMMATSTQNNILHSEADAVPVLSTTIHVRATTNTAISEPDNGHEEGLEASMAAHQLAADAAPDPQNKHQQRVFFAGVDRPDGRSACLRDVELCLGKTSDSHWETSGHLGKATRGVKRMLPRHRIRRVWRRRF